MSLFDNQLTDFREPFPPFNCQNSLTDHKKTSDVPLARYSAIWKSALLFLLFEQSNIMK